MEPEPEPDEHRVCFERALVPAGWQIDFETPEVTSVMCPLPVELVKNTAEPAWMRPGRSARRPGPP